MRCTTPGANGLTEVAAGVALVQIDWAPSTTQQCSPAPAEEQFEEGLQSEQWGSERSGSALICIINQQNDSAYE